jgi:hypothetical protein
MYLFGAEIACCIDKILSNPNKEFLKSGQHNSGIRKHFLTPGKKILKCVNGVGLYQSGLILLVSVNYAS